MGLVLLDTFGNARYDKKEDVTIEILLCNFGGREASWVVRMDIKL